MKELKQFGTFLFKLDTIVINWETCLIPRRKASQKYLILRNSMYHESLKFWFIVFTI